MTLFLDWISKASDFLKDLPPSIWLLLLGFFAGSIVGKRVVRFVSKLVMVSVVPGRALGLLGTKRRRIDRTLTTICTGHLNNAYIPEDVGSAANLLDLFFESGSKASNPNHFDQGEVWLFQNDLVAFRDAATFDQLYGQRILKWPNVTKVRAVVSSEFFKSGSNDGSSGGTAELAEEWRAVNLRLGSGPAGSETEKIVACRWQDVNKSCDVPKGFVDFVSDEAWIFYVLGNFLERGAKLCIHRRFVGVGQLHDGDKSLKHERIVVTASNAPRGFGFNSHDPMVRFVSRPYLSTFYEIFTNNSVQWRPLSEISAEHATKA